MIEWFVNLTQELMPEAPRRTDHDAVVARRHERIRELGNAEWRIRMRKGYSYEPTTREIWVEADRMREST